MCGPNSSFTMAVYIEGCRNALTSPFAGLRVNCVSKYFIVNKEQCKQVVSDLCTG